MIISGVNTGAADGARNLDQQQLGISQNISKLSSGLQINSAADDPAGLAASEQMRAQIGSLQQQIANTDISINKYQTAGRAVTQLQDSLIQLRSLAVGALNEGTNDSASAEAYNTAAQNLVSTHNRGIKQSSFGLQPLLDGGKSSVAAINTLENIDLSSPDNAEAALKKIDGALAQLSEIQGKIGSKVSEDLESTRNTLAVTLQNMTAAESTVRDVDQARETAQLTRNLMLQNSTVAVLAHASQSAKSITGLINP